MAFAYTTPLDRSKGWPEHMYSMDGNGTKFIPCPAKCGTTFKDHEEMIQQVKHYETASPNRMNNILHGILIKMHTLKICLVCGAEFDNFDSRQLFEHNLKNHQQIGDISKIQGFVTQVRKYANLDVLTTPTPTMQALRSRVLYLAYAYMEERVWEGELIRLFNRFMGYNPQAPMTRDQFKGYVLTNKEQYLPSHPDVWLTGQQYQKDGRHKGILTENQWRILKQQFQGLYRKGEI